MSTYQLIKQAILSKKCLTLTYKGYQRKMSPHVIGTKNGIPKAFFYQYGGESKSGLSNDHTKNWRCIIIDEIANISINNDKFQSTYNHSLSQTCIDYIDVEIKY